MLFFHTLAKWLRNSLRKARRVCLWWELASLMMTLGRNRSVLIIEMLFGKLCLASTRSRFNQIEFGMLAPALGISSRRVVILSPFCRVICCKFSNCTSASGYFGNARSWGEKSSNWICFHPLPNEFWWNSDPRRNFDESTDSSIIVCHLIQKPHTLQNKF